MELKWYLALKAYAFTHPLVEGCSFDLVPHLVCFGKSQKFLFSSPGEAQSWKRLCQDDNSVIWAKNIAVVKGMLAEGEHLTGAARRSFIDRMACIAR